MEVRSWEGDTNDGGATWRVIVAGVVVNRTGGPVELRPLRVWATVEGARPAEVAEDARPWAEPSRLADGAEAHWRYEGTIAAGGRVTGAGAALSGWSRTDVPAHCG